MITTQEPAKIIVKAPPASADRCALGDACPTRLTCELARQCLPQDKPDPNIKFAWANAICVLFILIGLYGFKSPLFILPVQAKTEEVTVPVLFMPPPSRQTQATPMASDSAPAPDSISEPMDIPEVAPAVAPANANVAFAVPVEGPVRVVPVKYAAAPPLQRKMVAPPPPQAGPPGNGMGGTGEAVEFSPGQGDGGTYPQPVYPRLALQRGWQGNVMLNIVVDRTGFPSAVSVRDSAGHDILDDAAADTVKRKWRWPAGPERHYLVPFKFQITQK